MSLLMGICVMAVAAAMGGLATGMSSRNSEDDVFPKIVWSIMQLMAVMVFFLGTFLTYMEFSRIHPPAPFELPTHEATASVGPRSAPKITRQLEPQPDMEAFLNVRVINAVNGKALDNAQVTLIYEGKIAQKWGTTDASGLVPFPKQPVGVPMTISAGATEGAANISRPGLSKGDNTIVISVTPAPEAIPEAIPDATNSPIPSTTQPDSTRSTPDSGT